MKSSERLRILDDRRLRAIARIDRSRVRHDGFAVPQIVDVVRCRTWSYARFEPWTPVNN